MLLQMFTNGFFLGCLFALQAAALALLYREHGALRLELMALPAIAGYVALAIIRLLHEWAGFPPGLEPGSPPALPLITLLLCAGLGAFLVVAAILLAFDANLWPLVDDLAMPVRLLAALLGAMALSSLAGLVWGAATQEFSMLLGNEPIEAGDIYVYRSQLFAAVVAPLLLSALFVFSRRTPDAGATQETGATSAIVPYLWAAVLVAAAGLSQGLHFAAPSRYMDAFWLLPLIALCIGGPVNPIRSACVALALGVMWGVLGGQIGAFSAGFFGSHTVDVFIILVMLAALMRRRRAKDPALARAPAQAEDEPPGDGSAEHEPVSLAVGATDAEAASGPRHAMLLIPLLGLACWVAQAGGHATLPTMVAAALPLMFIALGYYHVIRWGMADLGFPMYAAIGAYAYAFMVASPLHPLSGDGLPQGGTGLPPWACLALSGLLAAAVAYGVHRLVGRRSPALFAILTLSAYHSLLVVLREMLPAPGWMDEPSSITGISLFMPDDAFPQWLDRPASNYLGLLLVFVAVCVLTASDSWPSRTRAMRYAAGAAVGGLGGAWAAASNRYIAPGQFSMEMLVEVAALALIGQRLGMSGVLVLALLLPLLGDVLPPDAQVVALAVCIYVVLMTRNWHGQRWPPERAFHDGDHMAAVKA